MPITHAITAPASAIRALDDQDIPSSTIMRADVVVRGAVTAMVGHQLDPNNMMDQLMLVAEAVGQARKARASGAGLLAMAYQQVAERYQMGL